jgi:nitrogen regulatory protein PII
VRKIEAIVRSDRLDTLHEALIEAGINKMTVTEVRDYGSRKAHKEIYRSNAFSIDSLVSAKVEAIVPQNKVPITISIFKTKGQTGKDGEDRILISSVNDVSQTFSNEIGESV